MKLGMKKNWFDQGGAAYAGFRPEYPPEVSRFLIALHHDAEVVLDVGAGTGQLTRLLADHFSKVIGIDPSADQLKHAYEAPNIEYRCCRAEDLDIPDQSVDMITVAQAAHWFNLEAFYQGVQRVIRPNGIIALISYGVLSLDDPYLDARFQHFYKHEIGPFWPPERALVDEGYKTIAFPFDEVQAPQIEIKLNWDLEAFLGYLSTWSATRRAIEAGEDARLEKFALDLTQSWGEVSAKRCITWPINMRVGRV